MNTTIKFTVFSLLCIAASVFFLYMSSPKKTGQKRDKLMLFQNLYDIPLWLTAASAVFIDASDDPEIELWIIVMVLFAVPALLGFIVSGMVFPLVYLLKKEQKPKIYWCNVAVLILKVLLAPFILI